jgi:hypothetical protein
MDGGFAQGFPLRASMPLRRPGPRHTLAMPDQPHWTFAFFAFFA